MEVAIENVRKFFGEVKANDGITLTLDSGRIYGLLGENGAGKSTLMKILSGYHQPDGGQVKLGGQKSQFDSPAEALASGVGMVYQDPLDVPSMRVIENYLLGKDNNLKLEKAVAKRELLESASRMGFLIDPQVHVDTLSLGERQQLELLRQLALGAQVLILDEPTTGISAEQKEHLFASIRKLAREEGKTIILVSHKLSEVQELCDYVFILRKGKLVGEVGIPCATSDLVRMMFEEIPTRRTRASHVLEDNMLELRQLRVDGDRLSIENINLSVRTGEVFGLAGLEGSGQRLLLTACAGLLHPTQGEIRLEGRNVSRRSYHQMRDVGVAYLPAGRLEEGLVEGLTLREHIALSDPQPGFIVDWKYFNDETQARIHQYQIVGQPDTNVEALSGGNQQRVLFALLRHPLTLLLMEHPTRGLDVRSAEWIWQLLFQRVEEGSSIMFISADLDELIERSDRIAAFSGGVMSRVVEASDTSSEELGHLIGGEQ